MAAREMDHEMSLHGARVEIRETLTRVAAHPLTQDQAPKFNGLLIQWDVIFAKELALQDGIATASVRMFWSNVALNKLAGRVVKAILTATGNKRLDPLYLAYLGGMTLTEFRRMSLKSKAESMRLWIGQLTKSDVAELAALAPEITAAVDEADLALKTHDELEQQHTFFRDAGDRKKFFNDVNAVRKEAHGELGKLPFQHRGLPSGFADLFFLHEKSRPQEKVTMESVQATIKDLTQQLAGQQALLEDLESEADRMGTSGAKLEAKKALAAQLEREAEEAEKKAQEKRAQIAELNL